MKVSIRTAYRIVKQTKDPESDSIYIPQYQEEGSEEWHIFKNPIHGRGGGYNTVYFYVMSKALHFIKQKLDTADTVVYYRDLIENVEESYS